MNPIPSTDPIPTPSPPSNDAIAQCARELWTESGKPEDRDQAIWVEAERRLHFAGAAPPLAEAADQPGSAQRNPPRSPAKAKNPPAVPERTRPMGIEGPPKEAVEERIKGAGG
jgi:hypothetical protein